MPRTDRPGEPPRGPRDPLAAFRALHHVTKLVHGSLELTTTLDAVAQGVVDGAGFGVAVVNLALPDGSFEVVSVAGDESARAALLGNREPASTWKLLLDRSHHIGPLRFIDHRVEPGMPDDGFSWIPDLPEPLTEDSWHPLDALFAPLTAPSRAEWIGILSVDLPDHGGRPDPLQLELLELFADHAAIAIEHARMHSALQTREAEAQYAATHDPLTGLANRSLLWRHAEQVASDDRTSAAAIVIDLDGFKSVNDTHGHRAGDEVLQSIAKRLAGCLRADDVLARVGGDEFVVVLSGADSQTTALLARRFQDALARPIRSRAGLHEVSASIGWATSATPTPLSDLLSDADAAMYSVKHARMSSAEDAGPGGDPPT